MAANLDQDHRFDACGGTQRAHEAARIADALDVHQDALRLRVGYQIVEDLAEIHIGRRAHGNDAGEADIVECRPIQNGGAQCPGLRNERDIADVGAALVESCVQSDGGAHDAQAVRADQADVVLVCGFHHFAFQRGAFGADFTETGGDDDSRFYPVDAAFFNDAGNGLGRRGDDDQLYRIADRAYGGVSALTLYFGIFGIDGVELPLKTAVQHVLEHDLSD